MACDGYRQNKDSFVIRRAISLADLQWVIKMTAEEGHTPRAKEAECYFLAGITPSFYIGELNGKPIGCISLVKHGESVAAGGYYIVDRPYRGKGYGKQMFDLCLTDGDQCSIQTMGRMGMKEKYQKSGFQPGWMINLYEFIASNAAKGLASCQLPPLVEQILPTSQADFEKLFTYSADMLGTSQTCKSLLAAWLCHMQESSWFAIDNKGEVAGFLIMNETARFPEEGYYISPLYADSAPIARSLLKVAVEFAIANSPKHDQIAIYADVPVDNLESVNMVEKEFGATNTHTLVFMANKEIPSKCLDKVFSLASCQVLVVSS